MLDVGNTFKREIRKDPISNRAVISVPSFTGDVYKWVSSPRGVPILTLELKNVKGNLYNPRLPLYLIEENPTDNGTDFVHERHAAFGVHEIITVDKTDHTGLEFILTVFNQRENELQMRGHQGSSLNHFYPFIVYNELEKTLTGVQIASTQTMPRVKNEMREFDEYFLFKNRRSGPQGAHRTLYGDIKSALLVMDPKETRIVVEGEKTFSYVPYAPEDKYDLRVVPKRHVPRLNGLTYLEIREVAEVLHESFKRMSALAKFEERKFEVINTAIHSAPKDEKIIGDEIPFSDSYGLHFEVGLRNISDNTSYQIPFSDLPVSPGRPKDTAKRLRKILDQ